MAKGLVIERDYLARLTVDGEMEEGATAFLEKRKPDFTR